MVTGKFYVITLFLFLFLHCKTQEFRVHFDCSDEVYKYLVLPARWNALPSSFQFVIRDTIVSKEKYNAIIYHNGKTIAFGNLDGKERPHGLWWVVSDRDDRGPCTSGKFRHGRKIKSWWGNDGYYIRYNKYGEPSFLHSPF